jgi:hypothetical protein
MKIEQKPLASRRDVSQMRRDFAFKTRLFNLNLWRMDLSRPQLDIAQLLCYDTLYLGYTSAVYGVLEDMVLEPGTTTPILNYGRNDISEALNGKKGAGGLVHFGIVRVETFQADSARAWLLSVISDCSLWRCRERISLERMESRKGALEAIRRNSAPFIPSLEPPPDLWDAVESSEELLASEKSTGAHRGNQAGKIVPATRPGCSEFQNNIQPETGKQLTVHGITALKQLNSEQLTVNKQLLELTSEAIVMKRLTAFVGVGDVQQWGGDWRKNWVRKYPDAFKRALQALEEESRSGWKAHTNRANALKDLTLRLAGINPEKFFKGISLKPNGSKVILHCRQDAYVKNQGKNTSY